MLMEDVIPIILSSFTGIGYHCLAYICQNVNGGCNVIQISSFSAYNCNVIQISPLRIRHNCLAYNLLLNVNGGCNVILPGLC